MNYAIWRADNHAHRRSTDKRDQQNPSRGDQPRAIEKYRDEDSQSRKRDGEDRGYIRQSSGDK